jgi:hypothetical protein
MNRAPTSDLHADKKKILLGGISFILLEQGVWQPNTTQKNTIGDQSALRDTITNNQEHTL